MLIRKLRFPSTEKIINDSNLFFLKSKETSAIIKDNAKRARLTLISNGGSEKNIFLFNNHRKNYNFPGNYFF
jgi:hypothetical protein